jgi:hypothetical protein
LVTDSPVTGVYSWVWFTDMPVKLEPTAAHRSPRGWPPMAIPDASAVSRRAQVALLAT